MPVREEVAAAFSSRCFTSYVHEGLYLSDELMRHMEVRDGEIVKLISDCGSALTRVQEKTKWDVSLEAEEGFPFSISFLNQVKADPGAIVLGAIPFNKLAYGTSRGSKYIDILRYQRKPECKKAESIVITTKEEIGDPSRIKLHWEEDFSLVTESGDKLLLFLSATPLDLRKSFALDQIRDITRISSVGPYTQAALKVANIRNYRDLIESPIDKLRKVKGIGAKLAYSILLSASNCLGLPPQAIQSGRVTETVPAYPPVLVTEETRIRLRRPLYARLSVKGHPSLSMQCLPALKYIYSLDTVEEDMVALKDQEERLITIYGRWQIEFEGFDLQTAKEELDVLRTEVSYGLKGASVEVLYGPSDRPFDLDQFSTSLDRIIKVTAVSLDDIIWMLGKEKVALDTNVLVDSRLSYIILREQEEGMFAYELPQYEVIIPKVVLFEIKRMADDRSDRFRRRLGERGLMEVGKLRALADASIIQLEFSGEPPQYELPNVLRDEFILEDVRRNGATLLTGDERLARTAYTREIKFLYLRSINDQIQDRASEGAYNVRDACRDLKVSEDLVLLKARELERAGIIKMIERDQQVLLYKLKKKLVIVPDNSVFTQSPSISDFLSVLERCVTRRRKKPLAFLGVPSEISTDEMIVEVEIPNALSDLWFYQRRELREIRPYQERRKLRPLVDRKVLRMVYARGAKERPNLEELDRGAISYYLLSSMSANKILITNDQVLTEEASIRGLRVVNLTKFMSEAM